MDNLEIRQALTSDYDDIAPALHSWWTLPGMDDEAAARERAAMLPRLWLQHFASTSLVVRGSTGELQAFLVGFVSPDQPGVGYIHFVGVKPSQQGLGLGRRLYERFFRSMRERGQREVKAITSPQNENSIRFHLAMGFVQDAGDATILGQSAYGDYDGAGLHRCTFSREV